MRNVNNKSFGPGEDVLLDGGFFVDCSFDRCKLTYGGLAVKFKDCHFHGCDVILSASASNVIEVLRYIGLDLIAVGTDGPRVVN